MAEETQSPIKAVKPPVANPLSPVDGKNAATLKLKPVIRKPAAQPAPPAPSALTAVNEDDPDDYDPPTAAVVLPARPVIRKPGEGPAVKPLAVPKPTAAPAAPAAAPVENSLNKLKSVTQKLKDVTQEIPQQAILRKTGIIADQALTEAQKQASKARTARISLSDAIGAAPVKNENAPMKTIRIKRPVDIAPPPAAPTPAPAAPAEAPKPAAEAAPTLTQRKTLKIARPGGAPVRPGPKLGVKKPGAPAAAPVAPAADGGDVADIDDIPDMPTMATMPGLPPVPVASGENDVPMVVNVISIIVQVAACIVIGALGWFLYQDCQIPQF